MKTKIKRHSRSVLSVVLALCMLLSCMTAGMIMTDAAQVTDSEAVGAIESHFYLIGGLTGNNWTNNQSNYPINTSYGSDGKFYIEVNGVQNAWFALYNGSKTYAPSTSGPANSSNPGSASGDYDHNANSWQYTGTATRIRICIDETVGTANNKEWYPSVWVEEVQAPTTPIYSLSGNVTSDYIVGSTVVNTGAHDNGWAQYNSQFAINTPVSGTTNTYYVDITTQNTDRTINIGLAKTGNVQYAYSINGTAYDDNEEDYVVPSTGITDAMNAYVYPKNTGGSIVLQPDTSYRITINQSQYLSAGTWGKITVTQTSNPKIRFAVGSGSGTVTAVDTTTSTTLASGDTVNSGDSVTFTATPSTDYAFSAWYSDSACTNQLSASNPYTVNNVQGNQTVYAKFTSTNWPPIDLSSYQSAGSSSNCQIYVSKSDALTDPTYYFGGQADAYKEYELYKNGNNYWIELSQADVQKARDNTLMYYAFTDNKAFTGIQTSASVSAATNYNYAISSASTQDYNFSGADQRKFAKVITNEDFREYIENIGILYNSDSKTYTVYYYGSQTVTESVKIYAKDGVVRKGSSDSSAGNWFQFGKYANTVLSKAAGSTQELENYNANFNTYAESGKMKKGGSITLTTTMQAQLKNYYIRGYCINGTVYELLKESDQPLNASNVATATYTFTIPEDFEDSYLEITPIYFLRDAYDDSTVIFYVEDYDTAVQNSGWGNTLFADFFYKNGTSTKHLEGYPGQPLVFYGGRYFMQVATDTYATDGTTNLGEISGVTLNNGFWDYIHSSVVKEVSANRQTYDYSNFHKIYVEKKDYDLDAIVFSYKYRTKKDNYGYSISYPNISINDYASGSGNGWDVLKDYYGEQIDLFGNVLTEAQLANDPVYVVSNGYVRTYEGQYATEWVVYDKNGTKLGVIPSSALLIDTTDHWTDSTYSDECTDRTLASYQSVYNTLHDASKALNRPVYISYEKDNYASKGMNTSGQAAGDDNPGNRLDGLWYYSRKNAMVSANIKIEYSNDYYSAADPTWTVDSFTSGTATGSVTGTSAYFTNTEPNYAGNSYYGKTETGEVLSDSSKHYTFEAATSGTWMLEGWYLKSQSGIYTRITYPNDLDGESAMDANATFVARFKKTATGTLDIFHEVHPQASGYGHVYVEAVVKNADGTQQGSKIGSISGGELTDHIQIPSTYIKSGEGYKVVATFKAEAYPTSNFDDFYATIGELLETYDGYNFIVDKQINKANGTATITYDVDKLFSVASGSPVQTVTSITHYSKFSLRDDLTYNLEYRFKTRYYGDKLYKYTNQPFTAEELRSYFRSQIEDDQVKSITIDKQFVQRKAPFESNYREDLTWVIDNVEIVNNVGKLTATQDPIEWANAMVYDFDNDGDMVTQQMAAPLDKLFDKTVETKPADADSAIQNWDTTCSADKLYTALRTSYNNGTETVPLYLHHWEAYRLDSFTYNKDSNGKPQMKEDGYNLDIDTGKSTLVCKSYSTKFNYVGYEDYAIVPVYTTTQMSTPERQAESDNRTDCSATLLTITRNHWNETASGNTQGGKYKDSADRLYVDFMLNYNYSKDGENIKLSTTGDNIKVGFIVKSYTIVYENNVGRKEYREGKSQVVLVDKSAIDNKNRIEYCYGFNNSENNSQYGLNFEFTPFIIDTDKTGAGASITLPNNGETYNSLYSDAQCLDGVNFYMIGKPDTAWSE